MNTSKYRKSWLFLGACVGLILGFLAGSKIESNMLNGSFVQWNSLGSPEQKISTILAGDIESYVDSSVYVETSSGDIYQGLLRNCQNQIQPCWTKISNAEEIPTSNVEDHCSSEFYVLRDPPFPVVQCVNSAGGVGAEFMRETHFALLEDGNIWIWEHSGGRMSLRSLMASAVKCVVIPCLGFLVGWSVVLLLLFLSNRTNDQSKIQTLENDG